jgi:hypothetical protein
MTRLLVDDTYIIAEDGTAILLTCMFFPPVAATDVMGC